MSYRGVQTFTMRIVNSENEAADRARILIANSFRKRLGAYPNPNHKHYLIVEAQLGFDSVLAACSSISFAYERQLFSENYLNQPVQTAITEEFHVQGCRSTICEIGSLSTDPALIPSVSQVVAYFPWFAHYLGCEFSLVTVTSYMRAALRDAGVNFEPLCQTDATKLPEEERSKWGRYYDFEPQTGIIDLKRLNFLDEIAERGTQSNEMQIKLGCYGLVEA